MEYFALAYLLIAAIMFGYFLRTYFEMKEGSGKGYEGLLIELTWKQATLVMGIYGIISLLWLPVLLFLLIVSFWPGLYDSIMEWFESI